MDGIDFLLAMGVALVCGTIAQLTSRYSRGGWFVHLGLGYAGAVLGAYLSRSLNAPLVYNIRYGATDFPVIWSLIGSVALVAAIGFFVKPSRH